MHLLAKQELLQLVSVLITLLTPQHGSIHVHKFQQELPPHELLEFKYGPAQFGLPQLWLIKQELLSVLLVEPLLLEHIH